MQVADWDNDGELDILVTQILSPSILFQNTEQKDGTRKFEDVAAAENADYHVFGQGAAFGDVDGDGDLDMYLDSYGTPPFGKPKQANRFLINKHSEENSYPKVKPLNEDGHATVF